MSIWHTLRRESRYDGQRPRMVAPASACTAIPFRISIAELLMCMFVSARRMSCWHINLTARKRKRWSMARMRLFRPRKCPAAGSFSVTKDLITGLSGLAPAHQRTACRLIFQCRI